MSELDDANVDKDLLNQIFADEGDDAETDALLDEMLKEIEDDDTETAKDEASAEDKLEDIFDMPEIPEEVEEETEAEAEEVPEEDFALENDNEVVAEPESEPVQETEEETETEELVMPAFETNRENDSVRKEAVEKMDEERKDGTVTTITAGTTINGGISSDGSLEVMGTITGDIECQGKVAIVGNVTGNVIASEIYVSTDRLEGSLSSEGAVKIGIGTIVVGDVDATSAYIAGAVQGDIDVNGQVIVDSTAIIQGNIKAKSVQVNNGAVVDGYCSLNYAGVNLVDFFEKK